MASFHVHLLLQEARQGNDLQVQAYLDLVFNDDLDKWKSTSGYLFLLAGKQYHGLEENKLPPYYHLMEPDYHLVDLRGCRGRNLGQLIPHGIGAV